MIKKSPVRGKLNRKLAIAISAFLLLAAAIALLWNTPDSRVGSGNISVSFLNYTNTSAGSNAVSFVISNSGPEEVTIANYFFMCPRDQTWDVASDRRVVLRSRKAAELTLNKAAGDCTLLVLYSGYDWREAVRHLAARARLLRFFHGSKWGLPSKYERTTIEVSDPPKSTADSHPK